MPDDGKTPGQVVFESMQEAAGLLGIPDSRRWEDMADTSRAVSETAARILQDRLAPAASNGDPVADMPTVVTGEPVVIGQADDEGNPWVRIILGDVGGEPLTLDWPATFAKGYGQVITEAAIAAEQEAVVYGYVFSGGVEGREEDGVVPDEVEQAAQTAALRTVYGLRQFAARAGE